jgi:hypothetical protein
MAPPRPYTAVLPASRAPPRTQMRVLCTAASFVMVVGAGIDSAPPSSACRAATALLGYCPSSFMHTPCPATMRTWCCASRNQRAGAIPLGHSQTAVLFTNHEPDSSTVTLPPGASELCSFATSSIAPPQPAVPKAWLRSKLAPPHTRTGPRSLERPEVMKIAPPPSSGPRPALLSAKKVPFTCPHMEAAQLRRPGHTPQTLKLGKARVACYRRREALGARAPRSSPHLDSADLRKRSQVHSAAFGHSGVALPTAGAQADILHTIRSEDE